MKPIIFQRQTSSTENSMSSVPSLDNRTHSIESRFAVTPQDSSSRASVNTYRSTMSYLDELDDDDEPLYFKRPLPSRRPTACPATPSEFGKLFPSTRLLSIRHDDADFDGNANLRIDSDGLTLYYARTHDLRDRDVSIRRYGRESGREVCHGKRVFQSPKQRPALSKALTSFRGQSQLARVDSGYGSDDDSGESRPGTPSPKATNSVRLDFANYAHVVMSRGGTSAAKRYSFEYWGVKYSWRRYGLWNGHYELINHATGLPIAKIEPEDPGAPDYMDGFVPPCFLQLTGPEIGADVADVIVSTAVMTLLDDSVKRKYSRKRVLQVSLPTTGKALNMEYVGPRRLIDEVFTRRPRLDRSQSTSARIRAERTW